MRFLPPAFFLVLVAGCPGPAAPVDAGGTDGPVAADAPAADAGLDALIGPEDAPGPDAPRDAPTCLTEHAAGDHYTAGDACNFCDCAADGTETCTTRTCFEGIGGCDYDGTEHAYGERFPSTDGCNECVCAASGLACTRRTSCAPSDEGAILLESLDEACGDVTTFTARAVLDNLPMPDIDAPFLYQRGGTIYPETRTDTNVHIRISRENDFFAVCRIPSPDQAAIDMQVTVEWITDDGAFDEGFPAYLRRNAGGFLDAWFVLASAPHGSLHGDYDPDCLDPNGHSFSIQYDRDGHASGSVSKTCETDIYLDVGTFDRPAP